MTRQSSAARRIVLGAGALLLATPVLGSCGFNYATNRVNTIEMGTSDISGQVDVLGTVIVSAQPGSGTLVASLVNNSDSASASLDSVGGAQDVPLDAPGLSPIEIAPRGNVTLASEDVAVTGDFTPGDFVPVTLTFSTGQTTVLSVPVVPGCRQWEGYDTSSDSPALQRSASATPSTGGTKAPPSRRGATAAKPGKPGKGGTASAPSASPSAESSADAAAYSCDVLTTSNQ